MPNISFDVFFDQNFFNISASRGKHAPFAKPAWKVRSAPKLPPKEETAVKNVSPRPASRPTINSTRPSRPKLQNRPDSDRTDSKATDVPVSKSQRRKPPKLGPRKSVSTKLPEQVSQEVTPTIQSAVGGAGTFAGSALNSFGNSINGVGSSINNKIRGYGQGVQDYGNSVMDWTGASGTRAQTASNPLGLVDSKSGGKKKVMNPKVYRAAPTKLGSPALKTVPDNSKKPAALRKSDNRTPTKTGQLTGATKAAASPTSKTVPGKPTHAGAKVTTAGKKPIATQSRPMRNAEAKPARAKAGASINRKTAQNPLGLSWETK